MSTSTAERIPGGGFLYILQHRSWTGSLNWTLFMAPEPWHVERTGLRFKSQTLFYLACY